VGSRWPVSSELGWFADFHHAISNQEIRDGLTTAPPAGEVTLPRGGAPAARQELGDSSVASNSCDRTIFVTDVLD
jgi:hypothetical protein